MKMIYLDGFSKEELAHGKYAIHSNILQSITSICKAMKKLNIKYEKPELEVLFFSKIQINHKNFSSKKKKKSKGFR